MNVRRAVSLFLIAFGVLGYMVCVPLAYFSNSVIGSMPSYLDEVNVNLGRVTEVISGAENALAGFGVTIDDIVTGIAAFNVTSLKEEVNATFTDVVVMLNATDHALRSVQDMLNETGETIEAVGVLLYENADMMALFSNSSGIQTIAPEVAAAAGGLAVTMRGTADALVELPINATVHVLHALPLNATAEQLGGFQGTLDATLALLEYAVAETMPRIQTFSTDLDTVQTLIGDTRSYVASWRIAITGLQDNVGMLRTGVIVILAYLALLHTAFLLIGILVHRQAL